MTDRQRRRRLDRAGAAIVRGGTLIATAVALAGTPHLDQLLPILAGGVAWFVVIVPGALFGEPWARRPREEGGPS